MTQKKLPGLVTSPSRVLGFLHRTRSSFLVDFCAGYIWVVQYVTGLGINTLIVSELDKIVHDTLFHGGSCAFNPGLERL